MEKFLENESLVLYLKRLINKIYKLMPMKENNDVNYLLYLAKVISQLNGGKYFMSKNHSFIEIIFNLESLYDINDLKLHNSIVKESISLCDKLIKELELVGDNDEL
jgi:hypothetical protein